MLRPEDDPDGLQNTRTNAATILITEDNPEGLQSSHVHTTTVLRPEDDLDGIQSETTSHQNRTNLKSTRPPRVEVRRIQNLTVKTKVTQETRPSLTTAPRRISKVSQPLVEGLLTTATRACEVFVCSFTPVEIVNYKLHLQSSCIEPRFVGHERMLTHAHAL